MALIPCPSCGAQVSSRASACPKCGAELTNTSCAGCGAPINPHAEVCPGCGRPYSNAANKPASTAIGIRTQFSMLRSYGFYVLYDVQTNTVMGRVVDGGSIVIHADKPFFLRVAAGLTIHKSEITKVYPGKNYVVRWTRGALGHMVIEEDVGQKEEE